MVRRWIGYGILLVLAVALRVAYTDWLAGFLLAFLLLLPAVGVLVSVPAVLSAKIILLSAPDEAHRGEDVGWTVKAGSALSLPLGQVRVKVQVENRLTGERTIYWESFFLPAGGTQRARREEAVHCGLCKGEVVRAWGTDALGLFWLPLRKGPVAWQLILPNGRGEVPVLPEVRNPGVRPRPGGGPGEDYDPRDYRPGDPLNSIHWKLSAKRDELIVRETLEEVHSPLALTFDHFGTPKELDETLELLCAAGEHLLWEGRSFDVVWARAESGETRRFTVENEWALKACLTAALSEPAPQTGKSILDAPRLPGGVHLKPGEEGKRL